MRIILAVLGVVALFFTVSFAMVLGILAFTPTQSCTDYPAQGVCTYGQLPMKLILFAPPVILVATSFATWFRTTTGPRAYWPYIGMAATIGVFLVATQIVS